ncbi:MAG: histidinol-phosphatase HisJ family protein [Clostridia bacterium]|nr:histidinol-phosphatase HisJ family protein [Clostridia bacterium]
MILADSHTHSLYSPDAYPTPSEMCAAAAEAGVSAFALTDHYDIDCILLGLCPDYDADAARHAIEKAAKEYAGKVEIVRGIELGGAATCPDEAKAFLKKHAFDFVIGSLHNLPGVPDYYYMQFTEMPQVQIEYWFRRGLIHLCKTAKFPGIHTIGHLLYPVRYITRSGRALELSHFEAEFRALFEVMRDYGVAMELNTKGVRTGGESWDQEEYVLRLWYDVGGRRVTCGSDAHNAAEIGASIEDAYAHLRAIGFNDVIVPAYGGPKTVPIV